MLVITRKKGESFLIGDNIEVTVVSTNENNVKLSISAPKEVTILRKELYNEVSEENKNAQSFNSEVLKSFRYKK